MRRDSTGAVWCGYKCVASIHTDKSHLGVRVAHAPLERQDPRVRHLSSNHYYYDSVSNITIPVSTVTSCGFCVSNTEIRCVLHCVPTQPARYGVSTTQPVRSDVSHCVASKGTVSNFGVRVAHAPLERQDSRVRHLESNQYYYDSASTITMPL